MENKLIISKESNVFETPYKTIRKLQSENDKLKKQIQETLVDLFKATHEKELLKIQNKEYREKSLSAKIENLGLYSGIEYLLLKNSILTVNTLQQLSYEDLLSIVIYESSINQINRKFELFGISIIKQPKSKDKDVLITKCKAEINQELYAAIQNHDLDAEILSTNIGFLECNNKVNNIFKYNGIKRIEHLLDYEWRDLLEMKNLGTKARIHIVQRLASYLLRKL